MEIIYTFAGVEMSLKIVHLTVNRKFKHNNSELIILFF